MSDNQVLITVITAILAGAGTSMLTMIYNNARERRDRHREHFSRAFQAVADYSEFPFIVRRRRASDAEGERIRISADIRQVQADLTYHQAWIMTESKEVGVAYARLISELRRIAGTLIHEAWLLPPIEADEGMNIPDIGSKLRELAPFKENYLTEVIDHLSIWPRWLRRFSRSSNASRASEPLNGFTVTPPSPTSRP